MKCSSCRPPGPCKAGKPICDANDGRAPAPQPGARDPADGHRVADHHRSVVGRHLFPGRAGVRDGPVQYLLAVEVVRLCQRRHHRLLAHAPGPEARLDHRLGSSGWLRPAAAHRHGPDLRRERRNRGRYAPLPDAAGRAAGPHLGGRGIRGARSDRAGSRAAAQRPVRTTLPALPGDVPSRPARGGARQILKSDLGRAPRRGRVARHRSARPGTSGPDRVRCRLTSTPPLPAALGHDVLSHAHGFLHIFQPAILFYANHWRLIAPLRALNSIYSLWELARMVPSHRLVTQSTYSLSWKAVRDVGYWDVDVIPEDSHMCFKVLFHFGQRVKVRPIFLPVYADAAEGATLRRTFENQYHQILRWAWGVSDIPYVAIGAFRARDLAWHTRIMRVVWYVEEHLMWPSHWFLLTLGGLVPRLVNPGYAHSALGIWQSSLISAIMGLCLPCLLLVILIDWRLRPEHPEGEDPIDILIGWASFALLPVFGLLLCALPALDAHALALRTSPGISRDRKGAGPGPLPGRPGRARAEADSRPGAATPDAFRSASAVWDVCARQRARGD